MKPIRGVNKESKAICHPGSVRTRQARWRGKRSEKSEFLTENQLCFFSLALEGSKTGVWVRDLTSGATHRSLEHDRIFGYKSLLPDWTNEIFLKHVLPDDRPEVERCFIKALRTRGDWNFECRIRRLDGKIRWLRAAGRHRLDNCGEPRYLTCIVQDVTTRKQAETELRQTRDELEQRVRERTAEMEIRAIQLTRLASELILAEQRERRRLAEILHDDLQQLLVAARIQTEQLRHSDSSPVHNSTIDLVHHTLNEAIESTRSLMRDLSPPILYRSGLPAALQWLANDMQQKQQLSVDVKTEGVFEDLPETLNVFFYTAARELLFNVVKHAGTFNAALRLSREGKSILLEVTDSGKGFDPSAVHRSGEYCGFGLFSIKERTEFLGGQLIVESERGTGSRFAVNVPMKIKKHSKRTGKTVENSPSTPLPAKPQGDPHPMDGSGTRVLLVDDHRVMREGLVSLLERSGVNVVGQADNGKQAVASVESLQPDAVVMDVSMPVMDGIEATRIIKRKWPWIRVIGLSMFDESELAAKLAEAGADHYLTKTGPSEQLIKAIQQ